MIICSVTSLPDRTNSLMGVLNSLLNSTIIPDKVIISVSEYYPRLNKKYDFKNLKLLRVFLENYKIPTEIFLYKKDVGPLLKLKSPMNYLASKKYNEEVLILTLDDDTLLYEKTIENILVSQKKQEKAVYCLIGTKDDTFIHGETITTETQVTGLGGYRGVLYNSKFLTKEFNHWIDFFIKKHQEENSIPMHDDHIFSWYFNKKNIPIIVVPIPEKNEISVINYIYCENVDGIFRDKYSGYSLQLSEKIRKEILYNEKSSNHTLA